MAIFDRTTTTDPALQLQMAELQENNQRLRRAVEELSILNELARAIGASMNSQDVIETITRRSVRAVNAEQGAISLIEPDSADTARTLIRSIESTSKHEEFHLNQHLIGWMLLNKKPMLCNRPHTDERFRGMQWHESVRTLLAVPLMLKSNLLGILAVFNKKSGNGFTEDDQRLLGIIAAQSAQVIENARLLEQEKSLLAIQEELKVAARIQHELLPKREPQLPGYDIAGRGLPAKVIGGDYYDFIPIDKDQMAICLGDVTGKGLPAALLMANLQATLRGQTLINISPKDCVGRSNKLLFASTPDDKFVTLFYGILNTAQHQFCYCNAGHEPPFHFIGDSCSRLDTGGTVVGIMDEYPFREDVTMLQPGDVVVIYSDGITEAMSTNGAFFGEEVLRTVVAASVALPAAQIADGIINAVKTHAGTAPQSDDITVVVVKRLP